ncbi:MAG: dihydropteroate synthase, partial [Rhodocyclales bacterium]|nr:dihydropteroate synthase [Rhodocyclales bacterium]
MKEAKRSLGCGRFRLARDRPLIMGIVNLTPDSFSGDGVGSDTQRAVAHAQAQLEAGADILDLGAESTRPGAAPVAATDEIARLLPVLRALRDVPVPISVDTLKAEVMRAALAEGAAMINDVAALQAPGALAAVAASDA